MTDSTPMSRLRELHRMEYSSLMAGPWCRECTCTWPCDVIAALDGLEERDDLSYEPEALREFRERGYVTKEVDALQAENARLREQAEALATALETASDFVIAALWSSKRDNLLADIDAALRADRGADPPEGDDEYGMVKDAEQVADHLPPGWKL